jgi:hypothetical protein
MIAVVASTHIQEGMSQGVHDDLLRKKFHPVSF